MRCPDPLPDRLPLAADAVAHRQKVRDYLLNPRHARGHHKARAWRALGYERADHERLRADLLAAVPTGAVTGCRPSPAVGLLWRVKLTLTGPNGRTAEVRSQWEALAPGAAPRLVSATPDV